MGEEAEVHVEETPTPGLVNGGVDRLYNIM